MKFLLAILFVWVFVYAGISQDFSAKEQKQLDSLNNILNNPASHDTALVSSYLNLAGILYVLNIDTLKILCEKALNIAEIALINKPDSIVKKSLLIRQAACYNNIGYVLNRHGDVTAALDFMQKNLKIQKRLGNQQKIGASLNNIGSIYQLHGDISIGLEYLLMSLKIKEGLNDKEAIAASYNSVGMIYSNLGNIPKALQYYHQSLKIEEQLERKIRVAFCLSNIASVYQLQGDNTLGMEYNLKSLKIREGIGDHDGIATSLNNIGTIYYNQGEIDTGLEYFLKSLKIREEIDDADGMAILLNNIGSIYYTQRNQEKCLDYFFKGLKIQEQKGDKNGIALCLKNIATIYYNNGELKRAEKLAIKSLKLSKHIGYPARIMAASDILYGIYKKTNQYKKALTSYELCVKMQDSINNEKTSKSLIRHEMRYQYEKKSAADSIKTAEQQKVLDAQIMAQEAKLSQEQTFKYSLLGGLGLVALFSVFVMNRLNVTRKQKIEIELKNTVLSERNAEIAHQKQLVEHKNKEVLDSIVYAERIQSAILPPITLMKACLPESFVFYKPKDIVAGDFYWLETSDANVFFSAADCTGHGVPGAMMSVMCSNALTKCVKELGLSNPGEILDSTTKIIEGRFERSEQMVLDGMDLALCKLNTSTRELEYAGANNPLWIIESTSKDQLVVEIKSDKQPIGQYDNRKPYTNHVVQLQKGDAIYIFSDGYIDQFGGAKGKKLKAKAFKNLLLSIQNEPMDKQLELINQAFEDWRGENEQVDDICIIGVKV